MPRAAAILNDPNPRRLLSLCLLRALPMTLKDYRRRRRRRHVAVHQPAAAMLQEKYGFDPTPEWLSHLQHSAVRFNDGGSGSFISADGLVLTNHHVGASALQKLSTAEHDYLAGGFLAKTRADELRSVDSELNVLQSIEDVTARVNAAVTPGMTSAQAHAARQAAINTIQKESHDATGLRSDVVTLYQAAVYHLYRYKRYTDVRLVFAPEQSIAFFGGDPDNLNIRATIWICACSASTKTASRPKSKTICDSRPASARESWCSSPGIRATPTGSIRSRNLEFVRDWVLPKSLERLFRKEVSARSFSRRSREKPPRRETNCSACKTAARHASANSPGCKTRESWPASSAAEAAAREADRDPKLQDDLAAWTT